MNGIEERLKGGSTARSENPGKPGKLGNWNKGGEFNPGRGSVVSGSVGSESVGSEGSEKLGKIEGSDITGNVIHGNGGGITVTPTLESTSTPKFAADGEIIAATSHRVSNRPAPPVIDLPLQLMAPILCDL
ncbi:unnamed protein product [Calypogeia fissa]